MCCGSMTCFGTSDKAHCSTAASSDALRDPGCEGHRMLVLETMRPHTTSTCIAGWKAWMDSLLPTVQPAGLSVADVLIYLPAMALPVRKLKDCKSGVPLVRLYCKESHWAMTWQQQQVPTGLSYFQITSEVEVYVSLTFSGEAVQHKSTQNGAHASSWLQGESRGQMPAAVPAFGISKALVAGPLCSEFTGNSAYQGAAAGSRA